MSNQETPAEEFAAWLTTARAATDEGQVEPVAVEPAIPKRDLGLGARGAPPSADPAATFAAFLRAHLYYI